MQIDFMTGDVTSVGRSYVTVKLDKVPKQVRLKPDQIQVRLIAVRLIPVQA